MNKKFTLIRALMLLCLGVIICSANAQYGSAFSNLATTGSGYEPMGLVMDGANNIYASNYNTGYISKITQTGVVSQFAYVGGRLEKMVMDNAGNIYVVSSMGAGSSTVNKVTPEGVASILAYIPGGDQTYTGYIGIAINKTTGNIYTTDNTGISNSVTQITPAGDVTYFTVGSKPMGIALDAVGNIYTANWGSNTVSKLSPAGALLATYPVGPNPWDIAIDPASGNIYTSNAGPYDTGASPSPNGTVSRITNTGTVTTTWATVQDAAGEMAIDASGNVYVVNTYSGTVSEIKPSGTITTLNLPVASGVTQNHLYPATILITRGRAFVAVEGSDMIAATPITATLLPITFANNGLTAVKQGNTALLNWATATEINDKGFEVQRSTDSKNWSNLDFVNSKVANGNSAAPLSYNYTDNAPLNGTNYYRLAQTDLNGNTTNSNIAEVNISGATTSLQIYPNPAHGTVNLNNLTVGANVAIYNANGQLVKNFVAASTSQQVDISGWASGIYFVKVTTAVTKSTGTFIVK